MPETIKPRLEEQALKSTSPLTKMPKEGVSVGVIGGVFMSSVSQTPEYIVMQKEAERKIRLHLS